MVKKHNKYYRKYIKNNINCHAKRKRKGKTKKVDKLKLKVVESFCIFYTLSSVVVYMLKLISKLGNNVLFQWCGIISDILSLPMSQPDLLIMVLGLHSIIVIIGIIFLIIKIYKFFRNYNHI